MFRNFIRIRIQCLLPTPLVIPIIAPLHHITVTFFSLPHLSLSPIASHRNVVPYNHRSTNIVSSNGRGLWCLYLHEENL